MATQTTYFALPLAEGTDYYNHLVFDNPAFVEIDKQMYKNQNAGVQSATHTKSGTAHSVVRSVDSAPAFYFVATAAYNAGDTFSVNGSVYTLVDPQGNSLQTGAFVVNSTVLCIIAGGRVTAYVGGGVAGSGALTVQFADGSEQVYDGANPVTVTLNKSAVGLGQVDNTADAAKRVAYATSAGTAENATNAVSAQSAQNAVSAQTAGRATNLSMSLDGTVLNVTYS